MERWKDATGPALGYIAPTEFQQENMYRMATRRRAVRLILALEAWRLDHGRLPESLEPLVGTYLDQMPLDPSTGQPFGYFPDGVPEIMIYLHWSFDEDDVSEKLKANTPLVWSLAMTYGPPQQYTVLGNDHPLVARYLKDRMEYFPEYGQVEGRDDHWPIGWPFLIPAPTAIPTPTAEANTPDDSAALDEAAQ